jgi:hypothetical protein
VTGEWPGLGEYGGVWIALDAGRAMLDCGIELAAVVGVEERPDYLHVLLRNNVSTCLHRRWGERNALPEAFS